MGWRTALPSPAPQTARAARAKAVVSDLSSAAELLHPPLSPTPTPRPAAAAFPPAQVPVEAAAPPQQAADVRQRIAE